MNNKPVFLHVGFLLNIVAIGLFFPGILLPMFSLDMSLAAAIGGGGTISNDLVNQELSILQTVDQLWDENRLLVAILIFVFSVCVPLTKTVFVTLAYCLKNTVAAKRLLSFVAAIGKWSMADVFVVAIFLAVFSTNHADTVSQEQLRVFGFEITIDVSSQILSNVGVGFYYFVAYCLVSLLGTHLALSASRRVDKSLA